MNKHGVNAPSPGAHDTTAMDVDGLVDVMDDTDESGAHVIGFVSAANRWATNSEMEFSAGDGQQMAKEDVAEASSVAPCHDQCLSSRRLNVRMVQSCRARTQ